MELTVERVRKHGRNFAALLANRGLGTAGNALFLLAVARTAGPSRFGELSFALAVAAYSLLFTDLGLNTFALRFAALHPETAGRLLKTAVTFRLALVLPVTILVAALPHLLPSIPAATGLLLIVFFWQLTRAISTLLTAFLYASERMERETLALSIENALTLLLTGALLLFGLSLLTAISFAFVNAAISLLIRLQLVRRSYSLNLHQESRLPLGQFLRRGAPYAVFSFAVAVYTRIDLVIIGLMASTLDLGVYGAAVRMVMLLLAAPEALALALLPALTRRTAHGSLGASTLRLMTVVFLLLGGFATLAVFASPEVIFSRLLGPQYSETGTLLRLLVFLIPFRSLSIMFGNLLTAIGAQARRATGVAITSIFAIAAYSWGFSTHGLLGAAAAKVSIEIVLFLSYLTLYLTHARYAASHHGDGRFLSDRTEPAK